MRRRIGAFDKRDTALLHRHPKATEDEVEAIAAVVLAIVGEVTIELAAIIADLGSRVEALEAAT